MGALHQNPCHDFFGPGEINLLFNLILSRFDDVEKAGRGGKLIQPIKTKYQLRFHLYMAKFLPAKDENSSPASTSSSSTTARTKSSVWRRRATRAGTRR